MSNTNSFDQLSFDGARRVLDAAVAAAAAEGLAVSISICDLGGHSIMSARMDGTGFLTVGIAADKAYSVVSFSGVPTSQWWNIIGSQPELVAGITKTDRLIVFGGGVPITSNGALVGAIGVSGGSSQQDELIAAAGASAL
jgi:glc operon protein GlcG